jgi:transcriptional regulator with GAF, ATPase, and Fis domain
MMPWTKKEERRWSEASTQHTDVPVACVPRLVSPRRKFPSWVDRPPWNPCFWSSERRAIITALVETHGNHRQAAAALGLLPSTLHERMKRLGLKRGPVPQTEFS